MKNIVQTKNPRTGHYIKLDRSKGTVIAHKKSKGPYKNIPIIRKKHRAPNGEAIIRKEKNK